jgi:hypothetical protein
MLLTLQQHMLSVSAIKCLALRAKLTETLSTKELLITLLIKKVTDRTISTYAQNLIANHSQTS